MSATADIAELLARAHVVFWDFDGVIKESLEVKSAAFERLFLPYGAELAARVRAHHEEHSGVSRFEKIPLYLRWAGQPDDARRVQGLCDEFSDMVRQAVIDSAWVPGVREYLQRHHAAHRFVLLTATPQPEAEFLLGAIQIAHCFRELHGAPTSKADAMREVLERWHCQPAHSIMVGDSAADLAAAQSNAVPFVLRRTHCNHDLQRAYHGPSFSELSYE